MFDFLSLIKIALLSRALFCAADLSIAETILEKPLASHQLAAKIQVDQEYLERMMRLLMAYDFFAQNKNNEYIHTKNSLFLCTDHPQSMRAFVLHDDATRWNAIGNLSLALKEGTSVYESLYGEPYFDFIKNHPLLQERFNQAMEIVSQEEETIIAQQLHFQGTVADIGGGTGNLIKKILAQHPLVSHGFVFDICQSTYHTEANITYIPGSFFEPITITVDTFVLKRILHDWNDIQAAEILRNIAAAMTQATSLYIIDSIVDQCTDQQMIASIDLLLMTIFGGKERTLSEWELLCSQAGLKIEKIHPLNGLIHALECKKA